MPGKATGESGGGGGRRFRLAGLLRWIAGEPFRVFFVSGILWSVAGVMLWPLYYQGMLSYYPSVVHARLMMEAFAGAFVAGFLGTAGPRIAGAPPLTAVELICLAGLHEANALSHLSLRHVQGDWLFVLFLVSLTGSLVVRAARARCVPPPLIPALTGLACGAAGAAMPVLPAAVADPRAWRLAGLLLNQGMLLLPVLGIGAFLFPRMMGGDFGMAAAPEGLRRDRRRAVAAGALILGSFGLEAWGWSVTGGLLRAGTAFAFLASSVRWRRRAGDPARGPVGNGLLWALGTGFCGIVLAAFLDYPVRISPDHLVYIGGFGVLMLLVSGHVLAGHAGEAVPAFSGPRLVRAIVALGILTALTRAVPGYLPQLTVSHHQYAALSWALIAVLWLVRHRRHFFTRGGD